MKSLTIKVLWHSDETSNLDSLGIDYGLGDCLTKDIILFSNSVESIAENVNDDKDGDGIYTKLYTKGGRMYFVPLDINIVHDLIRNNL